MAVVDIFPLFRTSGVIAKYTRPIGLQITVPQKDRGSQKNHLQTRNTRVIFDIFDLTYT